MLEQANLPYTPRQLVTVAAASGLLAGTLNVNGNFTFSTANNGLGLYDGTLNLSNGTGTWTGSHYIILDDDSTLNIGAGSTLDAQANLSIQHYHTITNDTSNIVVSGTLEKSTATSTVITAVARATPQAPGIDLVMNTVARAEVRMLMAL